MSTQATVRLDRTGMEVFLVYHLIATAQGEPHSMHHAITLNKQGCELAARDTEMDLAETAEPIGGVYLRRNVVDFPNRRWKEKETISVKRLCL